MAEPSLLCVNCAQPPPPHRRTWNRCKLCVARNLPSTYYCGEECMNAHWPKHQQYHKEQKELAKEIREGTMSEHDRSVVEAQAREAERTGNEHLKRCASAVALSAEGDNNAAAKAWRKIIKQWPAESAPHHNLAVVLQQSRRLVEAAPMYLKAMELDEDGTEGWAKAAAAAFGMLNKEECHEVPKPEWWNDEGLKALSAQVVALVPDQASPCEMRAHVLVGSNSFWDVGARTSEETKEAATWFRRAAMVTRTPAAKAIHEQNADRCEGLAERRLAEEEAEAAKARVSREAAEAETAEALKVAEAKAAAAAEELLAEEEKEMQAASAKASKAKQGKGNKGKSNR